MELLVYIAYGVTAALVLVLLVYVLVRAASFAHFRTKLEYLRAARREDTKGDKKNGR